MFTHPNFDPVALQLGPLAIRWYGLMYLLAFALVLVLGRMRIRSQPWIGITTRDLDDMLFFSVLGVVLGGRLGYILFYKPMEYLHDPIRVFFVWEGGMAFHGGLIGVILAMMLFARSRGKQWLSVTDFIAPLCPLGLGAGRIGNFINGELWGRPTEQSWGMVFPQAADGILRHPSQLYEFVLEGLVLFAIVWLYSRRWRPLGAVSGVFLIGYGVLRFLVEFTREPDEFLGLLGFGLSMGQWLSIPMVIAGIGLIWWANKHGQRRQST